MSSPDPAGPGLEPASYPAPQAVEFVPVEDAEALVRRIQDDLALLRGEVADAEAAARAAEEAASLFDRGLIERATGAHESAIRALRDRWERGPDERGPDERGPHERVIDLRTGLPATPPTAADPVTRGGPAPSDPGRLEQQWSAGPESQLRPEPESRHRSEPRPENPRPAAVEAPSPSESAPAPPVSPPPPPPPAPAPAAAPPNTGVVVPNETLSLVVSMLRTTAVIVVMIVVIVFALAFTAR